MQKSFDADYSVLAEDYAFFTRSLQVGCSQSPE